MSGVAPLGAYLIAVLILVIFLMVLTHLLGERHAQRGTLIPYESGVLPLGTGRLRFPADYYLIAMFFVIFDVSAVFLFAWAVAARDLGWFGYAAILVFVMETILGLAYIWSMGAFDWGGARLRAHLRRHGFGS